MLVLLLGMQRKQDRWTSPTRTNEDNSVELSRAGKLASSSGTSEVLEV